MNNALGQDPGNFYIWRAADDFAIHLGIRAVTQLTSQISRATSQRRAGELRGILLGRTMDEPFRATVIEDIEMIVEDPSANKEGVDTLLEIACQKPRENKQQRVLGFFRSRRDGKLNMGPRDLETFSRLFCEQGNVALLIQTSKAGNESDAALFYWDRGGAHPRDFGFGFPFDAGQLLGGHPGWRYPDPIDHRTAFEAPVAPEPEIHEWIAAPPPPPASRERVRWTRLAPTVALAAICIGVLQLAMTSKQTVSAATPETAPAKQEARVSPETSAAPIQHGLGLSVATHAHQLEIRWNRSSGPIAGADKGTMKITEQDITEALPLDASQLSDGYVAYTPKTNDVSIRLEVTGKDGVNTSESVRAVAIP
jgi:hypothetical protein